MKFEARPLLTDPRVLHEHRERIRAGLERDPAAAIASGKELVESLYKIILKHQDIEFPPGEDLPPLFKRVTTLLSLNADADADADADHAKASATVVKILSTLTTTVQAWPSCVTSSDSATGEPTKSPGTVWSA
ncbi:hypothetical protein O1L68_43500 [Streptomyces lydicus]|nr:hypothetical protein [Streptomyces lydicus]